MFIKTNIDVGLRKPGMKVNDFGVLKIECFLVKTKLQIRKKKRCHWINVMVPAHIQRSSWCALFSAGCVYKASVTTCYWSYPGGLAMNFQQLIRAICWSYNTFTPKHTQSHFLLIYTKSKYDSLPFHNYMWLHAARFYSGKFWHTNHTK